MNAKTIFSTRHEEGQAKHCREQQERLVADRVQFSFRLHLNFSLINIITAGFIFGMYDGELSTRVLLLWTGGLILVVLFEMALYVAYLFHRDRLCATNWERAYLVLHVLACVGVGGGIWWGQTGDATQGHLAITIVILVYAVVSYGMNLFNVRMFTACIVALFAPAVAFYASLQTTHGFLFMMAFVIIGLMLVSSAAISSQFFKSSTENLYRIEELTKTLSAEKEISEIALELADASNQAKTMFFAAANHDLRQPLHALSLLVGALKLEKLLPSAARDITVQMDESVQTLSKMFDHFLDISRIETGQVTVNLQSIELQSVFNDMMKQFNLIAADKGLQLRMSITDVRVHTDPELLERMLGNLIANAITYTESQGEKGVVWFGYRASRQAIEVRDSGVGIAAEHHDAVFHEFYQVDRHGSVGEKGRGLGLSIVRRLARALHLSLSLSSAVGRGSVFRIHLPALGAAAVTQTALPFVMDEQQRERLKGRRILLIEEDDVVRHNIVNLLNNCLADVRTALSSSGALKLMAATIETDDAASATPWQPDLIISDYRLAQQTWVELVLSARGEKPDSHFETSQLERWHCPTIFMVADTAFMGDWGVRKSTVLRKPIGGEQLLKAIFELL